MIDLPGARLLARALRMPGTASFRHVTPIIDAARADSDGMRSWDDAALVAAASGLRLPETGPLPREATARFLAAVREGADRSLGLRPFDEQLLACCALLCGHAVEMDTGEGKTLVGALAAAGHALAGSGVHVVSVNDYLAERDAAWMQPFFDLFGVSVGWIGQHTRHEERQRTYRHQVVYAPVSEIGFDVLRDRFATDDAQRVLPGSDVAIIDEADAVMIDEAIVPLVLAGAADAAADGVTQAALLVEGLQQGTHFTIDPDGTTVSLTEPGLDRVEESLGGLNLYEEAHVETLTLVNLALHARVLVRRDEDYVVEDGVVRLINTGRGRIAYLQRWPDGLYAAVEAKERVAASAPGVILDSITVQDLLGRYRMLSGMSGTIVSVAEELLEFYALPAGRMERHVPARRVDVPDRVVATEPEKYDAMLTEVRERHEAGQPILVGTQSVAESEYVAGLLARAGIETRVLNAKNDADEASLIARAGEYGAVTVSTQMSGRGTDIRLGGAHQHDRDRVVAAGGLAVVAVGRYPTRRLDAQLRGRAGRQGDPGASVVIASLDDELVQLHAPAHVLAVIDRDRGRMSGTRRAKIVASSQRIAEGLRRDRHRATWAYNRAIAAQREAVLHHRADLALADNALVEARARSDAPFAAGEEACATTPLASTARQVALYYLDEHWRDHLAELQEIRDGIHLRALAGQRPEDEFHRIALRAFQGFFDRVMDDVVSFLARLSPEDVGRPLDELGLRRPSATWTYMVSDDPIGRPGDRAVRALGRTIRKVVYRIDEQRSL